jgi:hypothetical protein
VAAKIRGRASNRRLSRQEKGIAKILGAPDALLRVERSNGDRLVMDLGGMLIEVHSGLSPKVAIAQIEIQRSDAVRAVGAGKLHASGDAFGRVVSHSLDCIGETGN